jgi:hypothetical protein
MRLARASIYELESNPQRRCCVGARGPRTPSGTPREPARLGKIERSLHEAGLRRRMYQPPMAVLIKTR